tara:strand:- start:48 stop:614 length:567 start_codon:yes stop_codon:yes gene_type:complete
MVKHTIFTDSIIVEDFSNENLKKEITKELSIQKNIGGRKRSNKGGFQTNNIKNLNILKPILKKCIEMLSANYKIKGKNITMQNLWINENKKNNYNLPHVHPYSHFSGVYYIDVCKEGGELFFMRDSASMMADQLDHIKNETDFSQNYTLKPMNNLLILFPSQIMHFVLPHDEDNTRISVSFNIIIHNG